MSQIFVQADLARELGSISLRQVTKHYGKECVVDAIDIDIAAGEFFSLLGPSGSGKTTTLMMLAGFVAADTGQICIDERDIAQVAPQHRGFGMVFQNYAIFPHLNVFDNVAFPLRARKIPKSELTQRVMQALELVRLEGFADRFARQLSGGQQQRVAIARAIVFNPSIVLMDEPLGALDKNLRYQMQVEIKDIQKRLGMTVVNRANRTSCRYLQKTKQYFYCKILGRGESCSKQDHANSDRCCQRAHRKGLSVTCALRPNLCNRYRGRCFYETRARCVESLSVFE
jgi:ABC-type nitrate/sulfonate/bicarbonate transport system ATPase subunit